MAFLGRNLSTTEFGLFGALFGLFSLGAYASGSIQVAVSRAASAENLAQILNPMRRWTFSIAVVVSSFMLAFLIFIQERAGFTLLHAFVLTLGFLALFYSASFTGLLIGCGANIEQSAAGALGALVRLASGYILVRLNSGSAGAIGAYVANYIAIAVACEFLLYRRVRPSPTLSSQSGSKPSISISAICAYSFTFAPFAIDQFIAQWQIPSASGDYTALATITKILFFGLYPLILVSYSRMLRQTSHSTRLINLGISCLAITCLSTIGVFVISRYAPETIKMFYGGRYSHIAEALGKQATSIAVFTLAVTIIHGLIATNPHCGAWAAFIGSVPVLGVYLRVADGVDSLIDAQILIHSTQAVVFLIATIVMAHKSRTPPPDS